MPAYDVHFTGYDFYSVPVLADDEDKAIEKAWAIVRANDGMNIADYKRDEDFRLSDPKGCLGGMNPEPFENENAADEPVTA